MSNPRDSIIQRMVSREIFMKYLYQKAISKEAWQHIFNDFCEFVPKIEDDVLELYYEKGGKEIDQLENFRELTLDGGYLMNISDAIEENIDEIDLYINKYARNWSVETLPAVDVSILRIAIAEIVYMIDIPNKVACNVAVDMAKKYCDDNSYKYINGILGSVTSETEKK